jgi:hypothetical protein
MNEFVAILIGASVCFVVPAASLAAGIWIGHHGMPFEVRWRRNEQE